MDIVKWSEGVGKPMLVMGRSSPRNCCREFLLVMLTFPLGRDSSAQESGNPLTGEKLHVLEISKPTFMKGFTRPKRINSMDVIRPRKSVEVT